MSAMDAIMLQHSKVLIAVVVSLAALTGCALTQLGGLIE